jgi:hypothetical protein
MTAKEKIADLMRHLRVLEFDETMRPLIQHFIMENRPSFSLPYWKEFGADKMKFNIHFEKSERADRYFIESYDAVLRKDFPIPELLIAGVNTKDLADRMAKLDWTIDYAGEALYGPDRDIKVAMQEAEMVDGVLADLQTIWHASDVGKEVQAALMYQYWSDTPFEMPTAQVMALQAKYEFKTTICPRFNITASETYTLLNAKALQTLNHTIMNNDNLKFLSDRIKFAGFGEELNAGLQKAMQEGKPEFQLHFATEFNKKPFEATLNFRKSDDTDMYFFNSYNASLTRNDGEKVEQKFYLNNGKGITAKEAFNLLDGRAVHKDLVTKEGQPYKAWLQLNPEVRDKNNNVEMKQIHEKYGYNLEAAIGKLAVAELGDPKKKEELMTSLQKGNVQSVTIEKDGSAHKMYMEADPRYKTVKLYDAQMKLVTKENLSRYQAVGQGAAVKAVNEEGKDKKKELSQEKKQDKQKVEKKNSLMPKKRESPKKGLSIA